MFKILQFYRVFIKREIKSFNLITLNITFLKSKNIIFKNCL